MEGSRKLNLYIFLMWFCIIGGVIAFQLKAYMIVIVFIIFIVGLWDLANRLRSQGYRIEGRINEKRLKNRRELPKSSFRIGSNKDWKEYCEKCGRRHE